MERQDHHNSGHSDTDNVPLEKLAYTIAEATYVSGISRGHLHKLLTEGHLTRRKVGKRTFIMRDELEAFMRNRPSVAWRA